jgi:hypothetical protein
MEDLPVTSWSWKSTRFHSDELESTSLRVAISL